MFVYCFDEIERASDLLLGRRQVIVEQGLGDSEKGGGRRPVDARDPTECVGFLLPDIPYCTLEISSTDGTSLTGLDSSPVDCAFL